MADEELKIWIAIRTDLNLSPGKMAVQAAHAASALMLDVARKHPGLIRLYEDSATPKIAVRVGALADLDRIEVEARVSGIPYRAVCDAGRSEVEPGTKTVCAFGPALRNSLPPFLRRLQLYELPTPKEPS